MPTPTATPDPDDDAPDVVLDLGAFTSPERLQCQRRFGHHWGDLMAFVFAAIDANRAVPLDMRMHDPDGVQVFPDEVAQYLLWVQAQRTNPAAELADFDGLVFHDVARAIRAGLLGKAKRPPVSTRSKRGRASSDGSAAA